MIESFRYATGVLFMDPDDIQRMYSAFAIRITDTGEIQLLVDQDGIGWVDLAEAEQISGPNH